MRLQTIVLVTALLAAPAAAQVTDVPGVFPASWEAAARGLEDKSLGLILPCGVNQIRANLRLSDPQKRGKIVPTVGLDFAVPQPQIEQVLLHIEDDGNGKPALMLKKHGGAKVLPDFRFPAKLSYGKDVAVTIRWNASGRIDVTADGKTASMSLSKVPEGVDLIVQGGKGAITNIRTARAGSGTPCAKPLR